MTVTSSELAERLDLVVRALPGVRDLYSAAPLIAQAAGELPIPATTRPALIRITDSGAGREVVVNVGVDPEGRAPITAAVVAEAVRAEVGPDTRIIVRISRIA